MENGDNDLPKGIKSISKQEDLNCTIQSSVFASRAGVEMFPLETAHLSNQQLRNTSSRGTPTFNDDIKIRTSNSNGENVISLLDNGKITDRVSDFPKGTTEGLAGNQLEHGESQIIVASNQLGDIGNPASESQASPFTGFKTILSDQESDEDSESQDSAHLAYKTTLRNQILDRESSDQGSAIFGFKTSVRDQVPDMEPESQQNALLVDACHTIVGNATQIPLKGITTRNNDDNSRCFIQSPPPDSLPLGHNKETTLPDCELRVESVQSTHQPSLEQAFPTNEEKAPLSPCNHFPTQKSQNYLSLTRSSLLSIGSPPTERSGDLFHSSDHLQLKTNLLSHEYTSFPRRDDSNHRPHPDITGRLPNHFIDPRSVDSFNATPSTECGIDVQNAVALNSETSNFRGERPEHLGPLLEEKEPNSNIQLTKRNSVPSDLDAHQKNALLGQAQPSLCSSKSNADSNHRDANSLVTSVAILSEKTDKSDNRISILPILGDRTPTYFPSRGRSIERSIATEVAQNEEKQRRVESISTMERVKGRETSASVDQSKTKSIIEPLEGRDKSLYHSPSYQTDDNPASPSIMRRLFWKVVMPAREKTSLLVEKCLRGISHAMTTPQASVWVNYDKLMRAIDIYYLYVVNELL
jgi:hypothetical protein